MVKRQTALHAKPNLRCVLRDMGAFCAQELELTAVITRETERLNWEYAHLEIQGQSPFLLGWSSPLSPEFVPCICCRNFTPRFLEHEKRPGDTGSVPIIQKIKYSFSQITHKQFVMAPIPGNNREEPDKEGDEGDVSSAETPHFVLHADSSGSDDEQDEGDESAYAGYQVCVQLTEISNQSFPTAHPPLLLFFRKQ